MVNLKTFMNQHSQRESSLLNPKNIEHFANLTETTLSKKELFTESNSWINETEIHNKYLKIMEDIKNGFSNLKTVDDKRQLDIKALFNRFIDEMGPKNARGTYTTYNNEANAKLILNGEQLNYIQFDNFTTLPTAALFGFINVLDFRNCQTSNKNVSGTFTVFGNNKRITMDPFRYPLFMGIQYMTDTLTQEPDSKIYKNKIKTIKNFSPSQISIKEEQSNMYIDLTILATDSIEVLLLEKNPKFLFLNIKSEKPLMIISYTNATINIKYNPSNLILIIILVVVLLSLIGGGYYYYQSQME